MRFLPVIAAFSLLLVASPARADYETGARAYQNKEWVKAIANLRPAAEAGDARALFLLGDMYNDGSGVLKNPAEAYELYKKAAARGNGDAMVAIGAMYQAPAVGVPDYKMAAKFFERAALTGNQAGAFFYGLALMRGDPSGKSDFKNDDLACYKWMRVAEQTNQYKNMQGAATEVANRLSGRFSYYELKKMNDEAAAFKAVDFSTLGPLPDDPRTPAKPEEKPKASPAPKKK
jgi:TPR repeat protein